MNEPFTLLSEFLERFDQDVKGHAIDDIPGNVRSRLEDFAHGKLSQTEQAQLVEDLRENPDWLAFLATQIKSRRKTRKSTGD